MRMRPSGRPGLSAGRLRPLLACACLSAVLALPASAGILFDAPFLAFDTARNPSAVAIGDLNRDGRPDLAVTNYTSSNVSVLLGNGDGTFGTQTVFVTGANPQSVACGDLNADGKPDLVVANVGPGTLSVLIGYGDGTFRPKVDYTVSASPQSVVIRDLNADGRPDVAVACKTSNLVCVLPGNGDGTLGPRADLPVGSSPAALAAGDLNADGKPDLVVACNSSNSVSVLLGHGDGTFAPVTDYVAGTAPRAVAIGDLNHDGRPDLAVANATGATASVLLGNGDGTFGTRISFGVGASPQGIAIADLTGDGAADIVTANFSSSTVSLLRGYGDGSFGVHSDFSTGNQPTALALADLDGDGDLDLAVPDWFTWDFATVSVLLGHGDGTFGGQRHSATGSGPWSVSAGDLDGDGRTDLVVANFLSGTISSLLGHGDGTFSPRTDFTVGSDPASAALGDLNGDLRPDVAVANRTAGTISVLAGNGDGTFAARTDFATGVNPVSVAMGDLNGDSWLDLAVANRGSSTVSVLLGRGDGGFAPRSDYPTGANPLAVAMGDLNGDGRPDLVTANSSENSVSVLLGVGDGTFLPRSDVLAGPEPYFVALGDLNGDGRLDLAVANRSGNAVSVLLGSGSGTFGPRAEYRAGLFPQSVAIADLDGDGRADLAVANEQANSVSVLLGRGDGTFLTETEYGVGSYARAMVVADLNGDRGQDIAVACFSLGRVTTLLNAAPPPVANPVTLGPVAGCLNAMDSCYTLPVVIHRTSSEGLRGFSARLEISPNLRLCGARASEGGYLSDANPSVQLSVTDRGLGRYTVDAVILGEPCGATAATGTLFDLLLAPTAASGAGSVTLVAVQLRDCANQAVACNLGPAVGIPIDLTVPAALASLTASPQLSGNGPGATTRIHLGWSGAESGATVELYRTGFGGYPEYDDGGGSAPATPGWPPEARWEHVASIPSGTSYVDQHATRDFWYYAAFVKDACGNASAAAMTGGTLGYFLGDVNDGSTPCQGNNRVWTEDVSALGAAYGLTLGPPGDTLACLDVGPTTDLTASGRPTTDNRLDFEDLMVFATNFSQVSAPGLAAAPAPLEPAGSDELTLEAPAQVLAGERFTATLHFRGAGDVQGLSTQLAWDAAVAEPLEVEAGALVTSQGGVVFSARPGNADAALLGVRERALGGAGVLATVTFQARTAGEPRLAIASVDARDARNRKLTLGERAPLPASPTTTALAAPAPNPFNSTTMLAFSLAKGGPVELAIYSVDGRRVTVLASGVREAGLHRFTWDGKDAAGQQVRPGLFFARLAAPEGRFTRTLVLMK